MPSALPPCRFLLLWLLLRRSSFALGWADLSDEVGICRNVSGMPMQYQFPWDPMVPVRLSGLINPQPDNFVMRHFCKVCTVAALHNVATLLDIVALDYSRIGIFTKFFPHHGCGKSLTLQLRCGKSFDYSKRQPNHVPNTSKRADKEAFPHCPPSS